MRIFITGGTGFIGRPLCDALAGHDLLVLTRKPRGSATPAVRFLAGELFETASYEKPLRAFQPDACVHLAWSGLPDYSLPTSRRNFDAGLELFKVLGQIRCPRVVVAGSCWEYGEVHGCVREDQAPGKQALFGAFKQAQQIVGRSFLGGSGSRLVWSRPFFVYGPGQRPASLVPSCISALADGRTPDIRSPEAVNDFIHVDDVARGLSALTTSAAADGTYNLGSGQPIQVRNVVNLVAQLMGHPPVYPPAPAGKGFWADLGRVSRDTGWKASVSLEDGIRQTLDRWRAAT